MSLPTGTVTFLFTDIEGSTRLIQDLGDTASKQVFADHRRLLVEAVESARGSVYQDQGESLVFVFPRAKDAVLAAVAAQRALGAHSWPDDRQPRVRMGLHTGEPSMVNGSYFGLDVHRAARICQAGWGGQILVSRATSTVVGDDLPDPLALRDLGLHRLKDLQHPEKLSQILHPELTADFPPLRSLDRFPNNLPVQLTSFIGREREIQQVKELLATARMLTLTGTGGCGKTRLALQVAADLIDTFEDGVWLVELASRSDPALVPPAVASVLGVREQPGRPLLVTLTEYLQPKRLLLVLDNCEHLADACAELIDALLRTCPKLRIQATSRHALGIAGEIPWRVPSLPSPDPRDAPAPERLRGYASVWLFMDRAHAIRPGFALTPRNAAAVAQICHRLDGLPLAIELAAARLNVLTVEQIADRLDDRFRLLTGGSRMALPRQQTLRAALDWSYDLLSEPERALLRRFSVFAGGCTLEAAEAVCAVDSLHRDEVLDLLAALVDKSLIIVDLQEPSLRYRMLETVRLYGWDLLESGEAQAIRRRHRDHFLAMAEEAEVHFRGSDQAVWLDRIELDHDNLRAALRWGRTAGESVELLRLAAALWRFWAVRGHFSEGRDWLESALAAGDHAPPAVRAKALHAAGYLAWRVDDLQRASQGLEAALVLFREVSDKVNIAFTLGTLGVVERAKGNYEAAVAFLEESLGLARQLGDYWSIARSLGNLGVVEEFRGNYERAAQYLEEGLAVSRPRGDRFNIAFALEHLGVVMAAQGQHGPARALLEEALALFQELGDRGHVAYTHYESGIAAWRQGDWAGARRLLEESLVLCRELGDRMRIARCLEGLAGVAVHEGQPVQGARLCGAAEALREAIGEPIIPAGRHDYARTTALARANLGEAAFEAARAEGQRMTLEQAVEYALSRRA